MGEVDGSNGQVLSEHVEEEYDCCVGLGWRIVVRGGYDYVPQTSYQERDGEEEHHYFEVELCALELLTKSLVEHLEEVK